MHTFNIQNRYGNNYIVYFEKTKYTADNSLAIMTYCEDPDIGWEPYAHLTVNLGVHLPNERCAYLNANESSCDKSLIDFIVENEWCEILGYHRSGYVFYPLAQFTDEFLNEICLSTSYF